MINKQEVEFIIKPDGNVEFTIKGVKGTQCIPIAELFKMLGTPQSEQNTEEFYEKEEEDTVHIKRT